MDRIQFNRKVAFLTEVNKGNPRQPNATKHNRNLIFNHGWTRRKAALRPRRYTRMNTDF